MAVQAGGDLRARRRGALVEQLVRGVDLLGRLGGEVDLGGLVRQVDGDGLELVGALDRHQRHLVAHGVDGDGHDDAAADDTGDRAEDAEAVGAGLETGEERRLGVLECGDLSLESCCLADHASSFRSFCR